MLFLSSCLQDKAKKQVDDRPEKTILFIGDAHQSVADIMQNWQTLLSNDKHLPYRYTIETYQVNRASLTDYWRNPVVEKKLREKAWDYLILNELMPHALVTKERKESVETFVRFANFAEQLGIKVIILPPIIPGPTARLYVQRHFPLNSIEDGIDAYEWYTLELRQQKPQQEIFNTGKQWISFLRTHPDIVIYEREQLYPNSFGAVIIATMLYKHFNGSQAVAARKFSITASEANLINSFFELQ
jgi:hypothetical protein